MKLFSKMRILIFLQLVISFVNITDAQNFERFSNKEGFYQNTINDIEQDIYGFLWFGTPNGLIRYDGYEFKTWTTQSKTEGKLSSNSVYSLFNDDKGVLWVGTNLGLNVYIPWLEKFYKVPLEYDFLINHIGVDSFGKIWVSNNNELFICELTDIEKGTFKVSENILKAYPESPVINSFVFKDNNTLVLATSSGLKQISLNTKNSSTILVDYDEFQSDEINSIKIIKNIFWIGTSKGLYKATLDEDRVHIIASFNESKKESLPFIVNTILEDNSGVVWVGTKDNGLYKYNQKQNVFEHYGYDPKNELGLSSPRINKLYQDDFNVLWIGTAQGGINKLDISQKPFISYTSNAYDSFSITDNLITSVLEDSKGKLWLSAYNSPLIRSINTVNDKNIDALKFENLKDKIDFSDGDIMRCIYEDEHGYIWFSSDKGVSVYNLSNKKFRKVTFKYKNKSFNQGPIRDIIQLDKNNILFAGNRMLVVKNPWNEIQKKKPILNISSKIGLNNERVQTILKEDNNTYWIGTNEGLLQAKITEDNITIKHKFTSTSEEINSRLSYDHVFSLLKEKNHLWVGTFGGGLNKMTLNEEGLPTKMEYFGKNNSLPDDVVYGIIQEDTSHIWLSTDMGLVKYDIDSHKTNVYDVRDGLLQNNFRQHAYSKGKSGYFYFGGLNGLTVFKPKNIIENEQVPEILITSLSIKNKLVNINEKIDGKIVLKKSISETEQISISEEQRIISFNLAVKHTSVPEKNTLAYKLDGFDNDWIENNKGKAKVTYTNLSAGDYVFKIKGANGDGVWSTKEKQLKITILPPWYNTWWSYVIFFIIIVSISIGIILYFVQHERLKQGLIYEKIDKERMETINQGKFRYFTNLSHEFRTPLTLISGPLERMLMSDLNSKNKKYLTIIEKNTKRLLSLVDQLITFREAEQGHVKLNLVKSTLGEFIYPTTEAFENYALEKNINFFFKVTEPNEEIILDVEKCERILFNLLSNSFKNTPEQGSINIEAGVINDSGVKKIHIDVVDNGKGIPEEKLETIFERFYQIGAKDGDVSGGGIGLSFCRSLVNLMNGKITVLSEPKVETRFSVVIPSNKIDDYLLNTMANEKSFIKDWIPLSSLEKTTDIQNVNTLDKNKYTLLVVEDEEDIQNFLFSELSEKYTVVLAKNGIEALEKITHKEPDLIISDVMMPEMDGYQLCEKIKSNTKNCHIPVLLLTALGDTDDIIKGLEFGADEYLSKPFSLKHLELRVQKLIETNIQIKTYFSKNSKLPKDSKNLELSKKEEAFISSIGQVIEKNLSNSTFGVEELSIEIGLSTSHFYRRLKQLTGQVPNVYLRNYRLQRAAELLKSNEGFNVTEVMYQIGIESNSYFSTSFKKLHGVSPSEFLKSK